MCIKYTAKSLLGSIYKTMSTNINLDQPLLEQETVQNILFPKDEDLIPKVMLKRILKIAKVLIENKLEGTEHKLIKLVVGYDVFADAVNPPKNFHVEWTKPSSIENVTSTLELKDFAKSLFKNLDACLRGVSPRSLEGKIHFNVNFSINKHNRNVLDTRRSESMSETITESSNSSSFGWGCPVGGCEAHTAKHLVYRQDGVEECEGIICS